jgi:gluconokinase
MVVILMGVAGAGKTTVGQLLAEELRWTFYDADDFHPRANVEKMSRGVPLDDEDREPWLEALRKLIRRHLRECTGAVLACSALKERYRKKYLLIDERVRLAYLRADAQLIRRRLAERPGHFLKPSLLDSQFAALEEPPPQSHFDASAPPAQLVREIRRRLRV